MLYVRPFPGPAGAQQGPPFPYASCCAAWHQPIGFLLLLSLYGRLGNPVNHDVFFHRSPPLSRIVCFVLFLRPLCIGRFLFLFSSDFLIGIGNGKQLCFLSSAGKMMFASVSQSNEQQHQQQYDFRFHVIFLSFQMSCHKAL